MDMWIPVGITLAVILLVLRGLGERPAVPPVQITSAQAWRPYLDVLANIPGGKEQVIPFHLAWIQIESGGNPAAIGRNGVKGPDGYPREIGLYQLYNPDDFRDFGAKPAELRAYCKPSLYRPEAEQLTRPLTEDEKKRQIELGIKLVNKCQTRATAVLTANHTGETGTPWDSKAGPDYWRLVKLYHALPGLVKAFTRVARKLGRVPSSWGEFRASVMSLTSDELSDPNTWKYRNDWPRLLDNAEATGGVVKPRQPKPPPKAVS